MPYLQAHREKAMANLIEFTMKSEKSGAVVKFSLKQLLISLYANSYIDAKAQEYLMLLNIYIYIYTHTICIFVPMNLLYA